MPNVYRKPQPNRDNKKMTPESTADTNDYALEPVPESAQTSGVAVGMINGALAFAVPGLITGIEIGEALGFWESLAAFLVGGLILAFFGTVTGLVGRANRLTSFVTIRHVFGVWGAKLVSFCFVLSLLGWYGVNLDLFALATNGLLVDYLSITFNSSAIEWGVSAVIVITTLYGFQRMEKLSTWLVPIMGVVTLFLLIKSAMAMESSGGLAAVEPTMSFGAAVSAVVGSFIVSIVLLPDLARFCRTKRDAWSASFIPFFLLSTFVYIAASLAANVFGSDDILALMVKVGLGLAAFVLLICSSWLTNVLNLYSASLGAAAVINGGKQKVLIIAMGVMGAVASSLNLLDSFSEFLFSLSIMFTPVAAIYCADFFILRKQAVYRTDDFIPSFNISAIAAWITGILFTFTSVETGLFITPIEAIDALIVSLVSYLILSYIARAFGTNISNKASNTSGATVSTRSSIDSNTDSRTDNPIKNSTKRENP